jgi:hypothetical protein
VIVNPDILRRDTIKLLTQIDKQIEEVTKEARNMGISPEKMRDASGNWVMIPLLMAKTQIYSTLVQLQVKR